MDIENEAGIALVGLGKMGISHLAIVNMTSGLKISSVVDSSTFLGNMVERQTAMHYEASFDAVLQNPDTKAVIIATPTRFHDDMARQALNAGRHVFCEKPLTSTAESSEELAKLAAEKGLVNQVGYHNRFVGTFREVKRLLDLSVIGRVRHVRAEAYGPVVLREESTTWRSKPELGGGCLYDYAAHPINLMNWYVGTPVRCAGAMMPSQYSAHVDDAVYAALEFPEDISAQVSVNWSDETQRKMTTSITIYGDGGKIVADRQELHVYIGSTGNVVEGYRKDWNARNITQLTDSPEYYLRGEEYSNQMEYFSQSISGKAVLGENDFASAAVTDRTMAMIRAAAFGQPPTESNSVRPTSQTGSANIPAPGLLARIWRRITG